MFGAPDLPRRPAVPPKSAERRAGVGDHVRHCGAYVGLIVDAMPGGIVTVAKRAGSGQTVLEVEMLADTLDIAAIIPLAMNERIDREWKRGALG